MKQSIATLPIVFTILLFLGFHTANAADETIKQPIAVASQPAFQFQPVVEGEEVTHDFVLKNDGKAPLEIISVRPG